MYVVPQAGHIRAFFDGEAIRRGIQFLDKYVKAQDPRPKREGQTPKAEIQPHRGAARNLEDPRSEAQGAKSPNPNP
jgi:hypothetical protein